MHVSHHYGPYGKICKKYAKLCKKYAKYAGMKFVCKIGPSPSIRLAVRENQSKNMPLKRIDLAKALVYTSF